MEQKEVDVVSTNEENTTNTETDTFTTEEQTVSINVLCIYLFILCNIFLTSCVCTLYINKIEA